MEGSKMISEDVVDPPQTKLLLNEFAPCNQPEILQNEGNKLSDSNEKEVKNRDYSGFELEQPQRYQTHTPFNTSEKKFVIVISVAVAVTFFIVGLAIGLSTSVPHNNSNSKQYDGKFLKSSYNQMTEAEVLQVFSNAAKYPYLLNWTGDDPCGDNWTGITCSYGEVIIIKYMFYLDAATSIPPEFSILKKLQQLILNYDGITGTIPPELSVLTNIEEFQVKSNKMQGSIPQQLSSWLNIKIIDLDASKSQGGITGTLSAEFSVWQFLDQFLVLDGDLTGTLPVQYSTWNSISLVQLSGNDLRGSVPEQYSQWDYVSKLYLSPQDSNIFCISDYLEQQLNQKVELSDINELPKCSLSLPSNLTTNALLSFKNLVASPQLLKSWTGDDPCGGNWKGIRCSSAEVTEVSYFSTTDAATSIPPEFSNLKHLQKLQFNYDGITGTIPVELSVLTNISKFSVRNHNFRGSLPIQLSAWVSIQFFDLGTLNLHGGAITGPLPQQFSTWKNLKSFDINNNQLSGTLPKELSTWSDKKYVQFSSNEFAGTVPEEFSTWKNFKDLFLSPQKLDRLCISSDLEQYLYKQVSSSDINNLPLCQKRKNSTVGFSLEQINALLKFKNSVSDPSFLRSWTGNDPCQGWSGVTCSQGEVTEIAYKFLKDAATSIPPEFSELSGLKKIDFSKDGITGTIPPEISVLDLQEFSISGHRASGSLPPELSNWKNLEKFVADSSSLSAQISGVLPVQYSVWSRLDKLDVKNNVLSGSLPVQYSSWLRCSYIQMSNNHFSGSVPETYSSWKYITNLYLSPQNLNALCISPSLQNYLNNEVVSKDIIELPHC